MIYAFFFVRKIVAHIVTFTFYCMVIPASVLVPEVDLPFWGAVYVPSTITLLNAITTPKYVICNSKTVLSNGVELKQQSVRVPTITVFLTFLNVRWQVIAFVGVLDPLRECDVPPPYQGYHYWFV